MYGTPFAGLVAALLLGVASTTAAEKLLWSQTASSTFPSQVARVSDSFVGVNPFVMVNFKTGAVTDGTKFPAPMAPDSLALYALQGRYVVYNAAGTVGSIGFYDTVTGSGWVTNTTIQNALAGRPVCGFSVKSGAANTLLAPSQGYLYMNGWVDATFVASLDMTTGARNYAAFGVPQQSGQTVKLARDAQYAAWLVATNTNLTVTYFAASNAAVQWTQVLLPSTGYTVTQVSDAIVTDDTIIFALWSIADGKTQVASSTTLYGLSKATGLTIRQFTFAAGQGCHIVPDSIDAAQETFITACMSAEPNDSFFTSGSIQKYFIANFSAVWRKAFTDHVVDATSYDVSANTITTSSVSHVFVLDAASGKVLWQAGWSSNQLQVAYGWQGVQVVLNQTGMDLYAVTV